MKSPNKAKSGRLALEKKTVIAAKVTAKTGKVFDCGSRKFWEERMWLVSPPLRMTAF